MSFNTECLNATYLTSLALPYVKIGNDKEMAKSEKNPTPYKIKVGKYKIDSEVLMLRKHIISRMSSYFLMGGHLVTRTEMNIWIRTQGAQQFNTKT